jgi:hypothetical protein
MARDRISTMAENPLVFISYSHRDEGWKDQLLPHIRMLE